MVGLAVRRNTKSEGGFLNHSEDLKELAAAMVKVQTEIKAVPRDSSNPFFKSKYAGLEAVLETLFAITPKHGLSIIQTVQLDERGAPMLETLLLHTSGQWKCGFQPLKPVKDDPQGMGSAITYARRYGAAAICGLAQEDDDGNAASNTKKPEKEPVNLKLTALQVQEVKFAQHNRTREELLLLLTLARPGIAPITTSSDVKVISFLDKCLKDTRTLAEIYLSAVNKLDSTNADALMAKIEKAEIILQGDSKNYMDHLPELGKFYVEAKI